MSRGGVGEELLREGERGWFLVRVYAREEEEEGPKDEGKEGNPRKLRSIASKGKIVASRL